MQTKGKYILSDKGEILEVPDLYAWAAWYEKADRHIKRTKIGPYTISTVFLGLDHSFGEGKGPVLFETMVFEGGKDSSAEKSSLDGQMARYCTKKEAEEGHDKMVQLVEKEYEKGKSSKV